MVDTILVFVTVISLLFAAAMGVVVWRVLRLEQKRSSARVDALVDEANEADSMDDGFQVPVSSESRIPPFDPAQGGLSEPWRAERPNPESRGSKQSPAPPLWTDLVVERSAQVVQGHADDGLAAAHLFTPDEAPEGNGRRLIAGFALATMFLIVAGALVVSVSNQGVTEARTPEAPPPLELLALEHARTSGQLAIRGVVRNPVARGETKDLVAVVFLYDKTGGYLGTLKHPVVETVLLPGAETPFEVSLSDRLPVARYRVTFHVGRSPVPHLDRRLPSRVEQSAPERGKAAAQKAAALSAAAAR